LTLKKNKELKKLPPEDDTKINRKLNNKEQLTALYVIGHQASGINGIHNKQ
jgi:hypothetical protein